MRRVQQPRKRGYKGTIQKVDSKDVGGDMAEENDDLEMTWK
jgi:hypothetical protein